VSHYKVTAAKESVMSWDSILFQFAVAILVGFLLVFVLVNILVGCDSWEDPTCVTPSEMLEVVNF
jgi:hypothetical protein